MPTRIETPRVSHPPPTAYYFLSPSPSAARARGEPPNPRTANPVRSPTVEASSAAERSRSGLGSGFRYLAGAASGWLDRWMVMGASGSKLEKALGDQFPEGERYFGLENFGNTCYCNSVLQVCIHSR